MQSTQTDWSPSWCNPHRQIGLLHDAIHTDRRTLHVQLLLHQTYPDLDHNLLLTIRRKSSTILAARWFTCLVSYPFVVGRSVHSQHHPSPLDCSNTMLKQVSIFGRDQRAVSWMNNAWTEYVFVLHFTFKSQILRRHFTLHSNSLPSHELQFALQSKRETHTNISTK